MAGVIYIPSANAADDLTGAVLDSDAATGTTSTGLVNETEYIPYALSDPGPAFTPTSFALTTTGGNEIQIVNGSGDLSITITSPAEYAGGPYSVDQSNEGGGNLNGPSITGTAPQCAVSVAIARTTDADSSGTDTVGDSYTYNPGLWIYDDSQALTVSWQWYLDGSPISGTSNVATYTTTTAGALTVVETTAQTGYAARTATSNAISVAAAATWTAPSFLGQDTQATRTSGGFTIPTANFGFTGTLLMAVCATADAAFSITGVDAGGNTASLVTGSAANQASLARVEWWSASVASTDNGIVVSTSADATNDAVTVYYFKAPDGFALTAANTATATNAAAPWTADTSVTTNSGDSVLMAAQVLNGPSADTGFDTLTGVTQVGTVADNNANETNIAGLATGVSAASPRTVQLGSTSTFTLRVAASAISVGAP